ncbi:MAG: hypothetical protein K6G31_08270 [Paludibacteraceae bacterium]|nr:hypothetical protein [Paludibacteraceae bacterium]
MNDDKEYNVLWIEDESSDMEQMKLFLKRKNINLHVYSTIKQGRTALEQSPCFWDAILLDGEVPEDEKGVPSLRNTIGLIMWMTRERISIPVFIFSGKDNVVNDESFKAMTTNISVNIYRKNSKVKHGEEDVDVDRALRDDMLKAMDSREDRVLAINYPDLFKALRKIDSISETSCFEREVLSIMLPILRALHNPPKHEEFEPRDKYNSLRQLVELIYRKFIEFRIVPDCCIDKGGVNLNQCQMYLSGRIAFVKKIYRYPFGEGVLPKHIENIMYQVLSLGNINSHTFEVGENVDLTEEEQEHVDELLSSRDSRFIIFGFTLQLMEVIIWLSNYLRDHHDKTENANKLRKSLGKVVYDSRLKTFYFNEDFALAGNVSDGDDFEITKNNFIQENTNNSTNSVFKYFIYVKKE